MATARRYSVAVEGYLEACGELGLSAAGRPLSVRWAAGKPTYRATARATDELALRRRVQRTMVRGPELWVRAGDAVAFARCEARCAQERAEASVRLRYVDDNTLMQCETRARRLATLRVLGLERFAEPEEEAEPQGYALAVAQEVAVGVEPLVVCPVRSFDAPEVPVRMVPWGELAARTLEAKTLPVATLFDPRQASAGFEASAPRGPREEYAEALLAVEELAQAAPFWLRWRGTVVRWAPAEKVEAWRALCARVEALRGKGDARAWLEAAVRGG